MRDALTQTLTLPGGRTLGYSDYGPPDGTPALNCHGGPGSRLEPGLGAREAGAAGIRGIGIDRPGYGLSTPLPGRSIADWVPDGLAVLDALGIDRCTVVGVSTGGAYALALAALAPERVDAVMLMCALTDMRWPEARAEMGGLEDATGAIWDVADREAALAHATELWGEDGLKQFAQAAELLAATQDGSVAPLAPADMALFTDGEFLTAMLELMRDAFARFGAQGYADDRIADGPQHGWESFDVAAVRCPVTILHGTADTVVPVAHAHHTAELIPQAELRTVDGLGHFSIAREALPTLVELLARVSPP